MDAGAGREFDRMAGKSATLEKAVGRLTLGLAASAVAMGVESVRAAARFQTAMELIHTQAGRSQKTVDQLSKAALSLAGPTATAPTELAKAMYHLASTGMSTAKMLEATKIAAEGAKMGGADLEATTNALTAAMISGMKGTRDITKDMGALNAIVGAGDMRMQDLADAFGTGMLRTVRGFGVTLNDVGAALATFGDHQIRGADAATQLRMSVLFLAKPAKSAKDQLKALGLTSHTLADDMGKGGLGLALEDLHKRLVKAGDTGNKMGVALTDLFGHKAGVGLSILEGDLGRFEQKQKDVQAGSKNFASDWKAYTQTFGFAWDSARSAFQSMTIQLGEKLLPTATKAMHWIGTTGVKDLDKFGGWISRNKTAIEDVAKALAAIGAVRIGLGIAGKVNGIAGTLLGRGGALGGGGLLGSAKPVPVYVTNWGGKGGLPGVGVGGPLKTAERDAEKYGPAAVPWLGKLAARVGPRFVGGTAVAAAITIATMHDPKHGATDVNAAEHNPAVMKRYQELLAQYQKTHPASTLDIRSANITDKLIRQAMADVEGYRKAVKAASGDLQAGDRALASYRSSLLKQQNAERGAIRALKEIPGAWRTLASQASSEGLTIGSALAQGVTIGISSNAENIYTTSAQVVNGALRIMRLKGKISSPSKETQYLGQMLADGLALGMRSGKKGVGQAASQMMDSVFGNITGQASLSGLGSQTDTLGASGGGKSIQDILGFLGGQASSDKSLARNLALARKHGLSKSMAQQVAMLGPDAGPIAASLAHATRHQIRQVNADEAAINRTARQISGVVSLSDVTIAKLGRAIRPVVHQTTPAQLDRHNGKKVLAH